MILLSIVRLLLQVYVIVLFGRAILSWFPVHPDSPLFPLTKVLFDLTEPVLRPVRKILPPVQLGGVGLDLSFLVVLLVAEFLIVAL
ncbi:MAG: YggT family protein [Actinobacteria bacterium]|jgi:YggT family protein|nr:YggT family protein [Actinomycetota bacterium]MCL6105332.1 YggT family protein [Actinomycetota bacterium]